MQFSKLMEVFIILLMISVVFFGGYKFMIGRIATWSIEAISDSNYYLVCQPMYGSIKGPVEVCKFEKLTAKENEL